MPKAISTERERAHTYEVGEIAYWSSGPDVAIDYRQDGEPIPPPRIIPLGKIDAGAEVFDVPGAVKVTVELAKYVTQAVLNATKGRNCRNERAKEQSRKALHEKAMYPAICTP